MMKKIISTVLIFVSITGYGVLASAQAKMNLDDLNVKGDLLGNDRLKMIQRQKNKLKNFVKYRTNYRKEIVGGLLKPLPKYNNDY